MEKREPDAYQSSKEYLDGKTIGSKTACDLFHSCHKKKRGRETERDRERKDGHSHGRWMGGK